MTMGRGERRPFCELWGVSERKVKKDLTGVSRKVARGDAVEVGERANIPPLLFC